MKDKILWILAFIWTNLVPLLLVIAFSIGILFNLWKVQNLPLWLASTLTFIVGTGLTYGLGKLLKRW
jgi:hypothetical protein